jgi:triosephosphate isomerase
MFIIYNLLENKDDLEKKIDLIVNNNKSVNEVGVVLSSIDSINYSNRLFDNNVFISSANENDNTKYVLLGHKCSKEIFKENTDITHQKLLNTLKNDKKAIICVGETSYERNKNRTKSSLVSQLSVLLKDLYSNELKGVIIDYEPTYKIDLSKDYIAKSIKIIKDFVKNNFNTTTAIVYGGKIENIEKLLQIKSCDGFVIDGNIDDNKFLKLLNSEKK